MNARHLETGEWGEACAARFLKRHGMKVLARRVRFGPREELDIVARDDGTLVFVEVKTRAGETFGRPAAAVDRNKQRVLSKAAVHYMKQIGYPSVTFRFDVVEVVGSPGDRRPEIRHIPNAFPLDARYTLPL